MISTPETPVKFKDADTKRLEVLSLRLTQFQDEITIAKKERTSLQAEVVNLTRERDYQVDLLDVANQQLSAALAEKKTLEDALGILRSEEDKVSKNIKSLNKTHEEKHSLFTEREVKLDNAEKDYTERSKQLEVEIKKFEKESKKLSLAKEILLCAIDKANELQ